MEESGKEVLKKYTVVSQKQITKIYSQYKTCPVKGKWGNHCTWTIKEQTEVIGMRSYCTFDQQVK